MNRPYEYALIWGGNVEWMWPWPETTDASLTFRAPMHYPTNQMVVFTFEGMQYGRPEGATQDLSQVQFIFNGKTNTPVAVSNEIQSVSYLISVDGAKEYTVTTNSFLWPTISTNWVDVYVDPDDPFCDYTSWYTNTYHTLTWTNFHNGPPIDFIRLWDAHQVANRSTRAYDPGLRAQRKYEDNQRSDQETVDASSPWLVLGGWGTTMGAADIKLMCGFSPPTHGSTILWKVNVVNATASISGASQGNFGTTNIVDISLIPSTTKMRAHDGHDFSVVIGYDANGDGVLQDNEVLKPVGKIRTIGLAEYNYCRAQYTRLKVGFAGIVKGPLTAKFLRLFLKYFHWPPYYPHNSEVASTVQFAGSYDQRKGLGCDPTSLTKGTLQKYIWNSNSLLARDLVACDTIWNSVLQPTIQQIKIAEWYADPANAGQNSHVFTIQFVNMVHFGEFDYSKSLGRSTANLTIDVTTSRASPKPKISAIGVTGQITDLYDYMTFGGDDYIGKLSRIQTAYAPSCGRVGGNIFQIEINCNVGNVVLSSPADCDDYVTLKSRFRRVVKPLP